MCVKFFFVTDFSATTWPRILKFGTNIRYDKLYRVLKNSHILLISPFICPFFFLSNNFFHHISSASMSARIFKFCINDEDKNVYH